MTKTPPKTPAPEALSQDDLDQATGGGVMKPVIITSYQTSGDADDRPTEEVAFYYNKIARSYD
ncbi:MAG: hypothetical protein AAF503_10180 [Pseudomonadota bacterium]